MKPAVFLTMALASVCAVAAAQPTDHATYYVATDGNDVWSGTLAEPNPERTDGPFATLTRARDAVRAFRGAGHSPPKGATVFLRGGRHALTETLELTPADSGSEGHPITYAAFGDELPVISGGVAITGWRAHEGGLWVADVPWVRSSGRPFHQLFVNGVRRPRARTPNDGTYAYTRRLKLKEGPHPECVGMTYEEGDAPMWEGAEGATIVLFHNWVNSFNRIGKLDRQARRIMFQRPAGIFFLGPKARYYIEDTRAALDAPGEWFLDAAKARLYYYPLPGEDMARAEVIAPRVPSPMIRAGGVDHLTCRGLSFQHADADLAPRYVHSVQGAHTQRGAFFAVGLRNSIIEQCEFTRLGEHGISLRDGCTSNIVRQCHFHDLGGGGVYLSEGAPASTNQAYLTAHNRVENNFIHDGGLIFRAGCGVFLGGSASYNRIAHNEICDLSWIGVHLGWSWTGKVPAHTHHNEVAYNHIHHIGNGVLNDIGGIYTLGVSPGTVLHHNLIHDVTRFERGREGYGGWGIYLDAGSSQIRVEDNIVHDTRDGGLHVHNHGHPYGDVIANNIFAYSGDAQLIRNADHEPDGNHVHLERNIACNANQKMLGGNNWKDGSKFTADGNCYWSETTAAPDFAGRPFEAWKKTHDRTGLLADPRFVDAARRDFRLGPDSPALTLGFRPIDISAVGLHGPEEWKKLPRGIRHRPVERPPADVLEGTGPKTEDFEDYEPGEFPVGAAPKEGGTEIRVSDESPAGGRQCVRFNDAAGATAWKPHWFIDRNVGPGKVRLHCAIRNDAARPAIIELEMRDWHGSRSDEKYLTGPHVRFLENGVVMAAGGLGQPGWSETAKYPLGQWFRVEVEFSDGAGAAKTYDLSIISEGGARIERRALPFRNGDFKICTWCGFSGAAAAPGVFFLDDVRLE